MGLLRFSTWARLARYSGRGGSSWMSKSVRSHQWVISAEYRFHIFKKIVAGMTQGEVFTQHGMTLGDDGHAIIAKGCTIVLTGHIVMLKGYTV